MSFKSVNDILGDLEVQAKLQQQPFQSVLKCWAEVAGAIVANHSRPLSIQRHVLWVATSSAAWAQNLTFQRQHLLLKLNQKLPDPLDPLVDIRFSTAGWQPPKDKESSRQTVSPSQHPSYVSDGMKISRDRKPTSKNAHAAFGHWAELMQARSHGLPLCPQCRCPTPPGELLRWQVCSVCAAQKF
ncbi:MAG: DciA family protein [Rhizonema sp. PD38]|nr:DciA family protein [Rhizonema sp. PD38]